MRARSASPAGRSISGSWRARLPASLGILAEERDQRLTLDITDGVVVSADRLVLREAI